LLQPEFGASEKVSGLQRVRVVPKALALIQIMVPRQDLVFMSVHVRGGRGNADPVFFPVERAKTASRYDAR
jgi:hypothetical protein